MRAACPCSSSFNYFQHLRQRTVIKLCLLKTSSPGSAPDQSRLWQRYRWGGDVFSPSAGKWDHPPAASVRGRLAPKAAPLWIPWDRTTGPKTTHQKHLHSAPNRRPEVCYSPRLRAQSVHVSAHSTGRMGLTLTSPASLSLTLQRGQSRGQG